MAKIGIVTLNGYFNYGNRLQNYALSKSIEQMGHEVITIWDKDRKEISKDFIKRQLIWIPRFRRYRNFMIFSRRFTREVLLSKKGKMNYIVIGSDQVWNPRYIKETPHLLYEPENGEVVISYAASFGCPVLPLDEVKNFKEHFIKYKAISVREKAGLEILSEMGIDNAVSVIDPTLLLTRNEWDEIKVSPSDLKREGKYILKYFLGDISKEESKAIVSFAHENNMAVIDLGDQGSKYFISDPSEFISLVENAELICTDSFHACVFSFIYDKSFIVFRRKGCSDYMYSRIESLLSVFHFSDREFNGLSITRDNQLHDYTEAYRILEKEREFGLNFLQTNIAE